MPDVVVALGSNLKGEYDSVEVLIEAALGRLGDYGLPVLRRSSLWRSQAWPDPADPAYLNAVALVETLLPPLKVLRQLQALERRFGRVRVGANQPRTLDLDLIAYGDMAAAGPELTLPHPRAHERLFVMGPLAEVAPSWIHPRLGRSAAELAAAAPVGRDARPLPSHCNMSPR
jgi:2-amino-4-hydroxy-6-hydroxymethyldihydropteridine diphosphokinase